MALITEPSRRDGDVRSIEDLDAAIVSARGKLLSHPIYTAVDALPRLRRFMGSHVFAVWDFMCLAKRLQRDLTSLEELWLPPLRPSLAQFINSIVFAEESDVDPDGRAASHFDLYLAAMDEVGASTEPVRRFVSTLRDGADAATALAAVGAPADAQQFVSRTLEVVRHGTTLEVLSSFLFGREDLIPEMFARLLPQWADSRDARCFTYYVKRHIELDGDHHGPSARRAIVELAGDDDASWRSAVRAADAAIGSRLALWDAIYRDFRGGGAGARIG